MWCLVHIRPTDHYGVKKALKGLRVGDAFIDGEVGEVEPPFTLMAKVTAPDDEKLWAFVKNTVAQIDGVMQVQVRGWAGKLLDVIDGPQAPSKQPNTA